MFKLSFSLKSKTEISCSPDKGHTQTNSRTNALNYCTHRQQWVQRGPLCHVLDSVTLFSEQDSPQNVHEIHCHGNHMRREMLDSPDRMTNALYILPNYADK